MNDFAKTIRLSTRKTFLAKNIDEGTIIPSDIGIINKSYFNYVVAFGAFTGVSYITPQKLIRKFKPRMFMKYRWLPLKRTLVLRLICFECNVKCLKTRISSDDRFDFNQNFCFNILASLW